MKSHKLFQLLVGACLLLIGVGEVRATEVREIAIVYRSFAFHPTAGLHPLDILKYSTSPTSCFSTVKIRDEELLEKTQDELKALFPQGLPKKRTTKTPTWHCDILVVITFQKASPLYLSFNNGGEVEWVNIDGATPSDAFLREIIAFLPKFSWDEYGKRRSKSKLATPLPEEEQKQDK